MQESHVYPSLPGAQVAHPGPPWHGGTPPVHPSVLEDKRVSPDLQATQSLNGGRVVTALALAT